ncbi:MAG: hypothetical protein IJ150_02925 [Bacteroidales bacterium]|nr:hypothetical protein [Bacteroidales bacterium]
MEKERKIFTESPVLGGYTLTVRDDWNYKLKQVSVTEKEKNAYLEKFGEKIITFNEFFDWWKTLIGKTITTTKNAIA